MVGGGGEVVLVAGGEVGAGDDIVPQKYQFTEKQK